MGSAAIANLALRLRCCVCSNNVRLELLCRPCLASRPRSLRVEKLVALPAPVCCRVTEVSPPAITLAPHPNPGVHPLAYQRALRHAQRLAAAAAAGEEDEGAEEDSDAEGTAVLFVGELDCWVVGYQLLCKVACLL